MLKNLYLCVYLLLYNYIHIYYMWSQLGEITGKSFTEDDTRKGMPVRSKVSFRKKEPINISSVDLMLDAYSSENNEPPLMVNYFDPSSSHHGLSLIDGNTLFSNITDDFVNNTNNFTINLFTILSTCCHPESIMVVCPIGILNMLVKKDDALHQVIQNAKQNGMYMDDKRIRTDIINRVSIKYNLAVNNPGKHYMCYDDNFCRLIEIPIENSSVVIGFMINKKEDPYDFSKKRLDYCISHMSSMQLYIVGDSFKHANKLNLNNVLANLGYINDNSYNYTQTIVIQVIITNIQKYKQQWDKSNVVNIEGNYVYYIRDTNHNLLMLVGKHVLEHDE